MQIKNNVRFIPDVLRKNKYIIQLIQGTSITFEEVANKMNNLEESLKEVSSKPLFKTLIKVTCTDGKGKKREFLTANTTVLGGRLNTIERAFNVKPKREMHLTQNDLLEIPHSVDFYAEGSNHYKDVQVLGFCIGDGAKNPQDLSQEFKNRNDETKMYNIMPLRCVEETTDLSAEEAAKYRLRKKIDKNGKKYILYFAKKIQSEEVVMEHNGSNYIPEFTDTQPVPKDVTVDGKTGHVVERNNVGAMGDPVYIYTKVKFKIEPQEYKEYYKLMNNNSLTNAGINEVGLIMGVDLVNNQEGETPRTEICNAELWAKMVFPTQTLASEDISVYMEYLIYS